MFSSASLAAVTTVVMFLLTYMPYIIVIAMDAVFGLGYKLLIVSWKPVSIHGRISRIRKLKSIAGHRIKHPSGTGMNETSVGQRFVP